MRSRALLLAGVALVSALLLLALANARQERADATTEERAADAMAIAFLEEVTAAEEKILTGDLHTAEEGHAAGERFDAAVRKARSGIGTGESEEEEARLLDRQVAIVHRWRRAAAGAGRRDWRAFFEMTQAARHEFLETSREYRSERRAESNERVAAAERLMLALVIAVSLLATAVGYLVVERRARRDAARAARERARRAAQAQFVEALQAARTESEADRLVKRQLERTIDGGRALVMRRNPSADRLEAVTDVPPESPLAAPLAAADPASCVAVRLARPHRRAPADEPLLACEICGQSPSPSVCLPSVVGGEVIGSVLLETERDLDEEEAERLEESVAQAAPVLANLRNLRIAERQAATDSLTGLPNKRTAEDMLRRMLAQASRLVSPLALVLFDLDHFKDVNDTYGHSKGDEVLAAAAGAAVAAVRTSDFVARYGGEEFVALLPGTDADAAAAVADKMRAAITRVRVPGVARALSASFGVAVYPDHGTEPQTLIRHADRALYAAKERGRNRVETATPQG